MTKLDYLNDSYLFESEASFEDSEENDKGKALILDQTIFYPQGGGQPADTGEIRSKNAVFMVADVRLDEEGRVWHFGEYTSGEFQTGEQLTLKVDREQRILNAKLHSAGHLLDCAVLKLGFDEIKPTKGFHFSDGPYVEYDGRFENANELIPELEKTVNELVAQDLKIEKHDLTPEQAKAQGVWAPAGKSARIVNFEGFPICGCGGTHIESASEIGQITIRKIKHKKGMTKISYSIA